MAKSKSFNDLLNDMYGQLGVGSAGSTAGSNPQLSGQGSTLSGASDPYANMFGNLDPNVLKQLLGQMSFGLSKEEQEELERLTTEHNHEIRKHKLEAFKKVAPEMRQFVINALTWNEELAKINQAGPLEKSQRLTELQGKSHSPFSSHGHSTINPNAWYPPTGSRAHMSLSSFVGIPDGLTIDDLKQAHIEATLEEEMLNGEEEKI